MNPVIARVSVDLAIGKEFDYLIPDSLCSSVELGCRVRVPFGSRQLLGYVTGISKESSYDIKQLKPIGEIVHRVPLLTPEILELSKWLSQYYCCPLESALKSVLPVAVRKEKARWKKQLVVRFAGIKNYPETETNLTKRQKEILKVIEEWRVLPLRDLIKITGSTKSVVNKLVEYEIVKLSEEILERDPSAGEEILPSKPLPLNDQQFVALDEISKAVREEISKVFLLYGVTGSGKTEVYLQAIQTTLARGRGAIVLVPEISLTPQTVERFRARFSTGKTATTVAVLHSHLSEGERHDEWHKIHSGKARIVIGARSAIFAPVKDLGLIVVDEEHEHSYKQEETPKYHARDVAVMRGHLEDSVVILGSATPSLESFHNASQEKYKLLRLDKRADNATLPVIRVMDLRLEKRAKKGKFSPFTQPLKEAMLQRLERGEQTMLFLNRRGYSNNLMCQDCGHVVGCPRCSITLTYHQSIGRLCCHLCGYSEIAPKKCSSCGSGKIEYLGLGTERVEESLNQIFPEATITRMDSDSLKKKGQFKQILSDFRVGKIDILIGTQMITKGLHFPNVTLVGIIYADLSLHLPDFRAGERTFQLITQVSGRAGRGDIEGEVFVQSYTPFHAAIQYARRHDFEGFYEQEVEFRSQLGYPPFGRMMILLFRGPDESKLEEVTALARKNLESILDGFPNLTIAGPSPAPLAKTEDHFRFQIMMRTKNMSRLSSYISDWVSSFKLPSKIKITVDVDPVFTA